VVDNWVALASNDPGFGHCHVVVAPDESIMTARKGVWTWSRMIKS
jgi:hypothetical protein